jgi:hypothetical protein
MLPLYFQRKGSLLLYVLLLVVLPFPPLFLCNTSLFAVDGFKRTAFPSDRYPIDVSFMIADLTYSQERGVQICEIQHGILSSFKGDQFSNGELGNIAKNLYQCLSQYQHPSWTILKNIVATQIKSTFEIAPEWIKYDKMNQILQDPGFLQQASLPVIEPSNIASYHGFLYVRPNKIRDCSAFKKKYPGIIILDAATFPFWIDKYKMTQLFANNPTLAKLKPKWGLYSKSFSSNLANQIISDLQCDTFVIKPRGTFLGNGVIIVDKENLEDTLKYILTKSTLLKNDPDKAYNYWNKDTFNSFLVEQFVPSDPIAVPHLGNKIYRPTMRVGFLLIYDRYMHEVKFLGGYWSLPPKSLSEKGSLNEKSKSYCKLPYYCAVDSETMSTVEGLLQEPLKQIHQQMLWRRD